MLVFDIEGLEGFAVPVCSLICMADMKSIHMSGSSNDNRALLRPGTSYRLSCQTRGKLMCDILLLLVLRRCRHLIGRLRRECELERFTTPTLRDSSQQLLLTSYIQLPTKEIYRRTIQCCALQDSSRLPCAARRSSSTACSPHTSPRMRPSPRHLRATRT